jgi:hypothetical protein
VVHAFKLLADVGMQNMNVSKLSDGETSKIYKIEENLKFAKCHQTGV